MDTIDIRDRDRYNDDVVVNFELITINKTTSTTTETTNQQYFSRLFDFSRKN
jgi:hypothetical protein